MSAGDQPRRAVARASGPPSRTTGPGIADIEQALREGFSTGAGLGPRPGRRPPPRARVRAAVGAGPGHDRARGRVALTPPVRLQVEDAQRRRAGPPRRGGPRRRARASTSAASARWRSSSPSWRRTSCATAAAGRSSCAARRTPTPPSTPSRGIAVAGCPTSRGRCATGSRRPAARAPGSARSAACRRRFDVQSTADRGDGPRRAARRRGARPTSTALVVAMQGEEVSGDAWGDARDGSQITILLADGLGHGGEAALAAATAVRELRADEPPEAQLRADARRAAPDPRRGRGDRPPRPRHGRAALRRHRQHRGDDRRRPARRGRWSR